MKSLPMDSAAVLGSKSTSIGEHIFVHRLEQLNTIAYDYLLPK